MKNTYNFTILILMLFLSSLINAQNSLKELTGGVVLHTRSGFIGGFNVKYTKKINTIWSNFYAFEAVNIRNPKEIRIPTQYSGTFILGKSNFLFNLRPQYGFERLLFAKDPDQGIKVSLSTAFGPTLGIVKPYIIEYRTSNNSNTTAKAQYTQDVDLAAIVGNAGWYSGIGQSKIVPGIHAKFSLLFEYSTLNNRISALETGFMYEQMASKVEFNPFIRGESSFFIAFVTLNFGKKL